jgi:hypothetical protein
MRLISGDVFSIKTKLGFAFLQFVEMGKYGVEIVRILTPINESNEITQEQVNLRERFTVEFVVKAAFRRKILNQTGHFEIPSYYSVPERTISPHKLCGDFLGWFITDRDTGLRQLKKELEGDDLELSPSGIVNDTLLIDWIENDFRPSDWK